MSTTSVSGIWDPDQYNQFASDRARPFDELIASIDLPGAREIIDLGCGTGSLTSKLGELWPNARVIGIDSSPEMLSQAERFSIEGRVEFRLGDVETFEPESPLDIIVSNATFHWVPSHLQLFGRLAKFLKPGGVFAFQVPGNFRAPSHHVLSQLARSPRWHEWLAQVNEPAFSHEPDEYLEALLSCGLIARTWETTYYQLLRGEDAVLEWMKGTTLRPYLTALSPNPDAKAAFLEEYRDLLRDAYPPGATGTVFPFRRVFGSAKRPGSGQESAVAFADHVQLAMPEGSEEEARGFYAGVLGFVEVAKPPVLAARGGCWFKAHRAELHLGVEADFRPARKAHPAFTITDLDAMADRVASAGFRVSWDEELAPRRRLYADDPFGNRIELLSYP